jgi:N-methylhydantoinase A
MNRVAKGIFKELESRGTEHGFLEHGVRELGIGIRHTGGHEHHLMIGVPWTADGISWDSAAIEEAYRDSYRKIFGVTLENSLEAIVLRAVIRRSLERRLKAVPMQHAPSVDSSSTQTLSVYSLARAAILPAKALQRTAVSQSAHKGPAIIYEDTATTFVDADFSYRTDHTGCIVLERQE